MPPVAGSPIRLVSRWWRDMASLERRKRKRRRQQHIEIPVKLGHAQAEFRTAVDGRNVLHVRYARSRLGYSHEAGIEQRPALRRNRGMDGGSASKPMRREDRGGIGEP